MRFLPQQSSLLPPEMSSSRQCTLRGEHVNLLLATFHSSITPPLCHPTRPFALASFTGMYLLESVAAWSQQAHPSAACVRKQEQRMPMSAALGVVVSTWGAGLAFAVAGALRSNGTLLVGYLLYSALRLQVTTRGPIRGVQAVLVWGSTIGASALALTPYVLFQLYGKYTYCEVAPLGVREALLSAFQLALPAELSTGPRPWCDGSVLPNMYGFIQGEYWGVGPFKYYQLKQVPQFLFAAPMLSAGAAACLYLAVEGGSRQLGLLSSLLQGMLQPTSTALADPPVERGSAKKAEAAQAAGQDLLHSLMPELGGLTRRGGGGPRQEPDTVQVLGTTEGAEAPTTPLCEAGVLPYGCHLALMLLVAVVIMHIQVVTRFLASSSPVVYWYLALLMPASDEPMRVCSPAGRVVLWLALYGVLGPLLFGNFQNWT